MSASSVVLPKGYIEKPSEVIMRVCGRSSVECSEYDDNPDICCSCIGNPIGYGIGNDVY